MSDDLDIVVRLRVWADACVRGDHCPDEAAYLREAADDIERLRAENERHDRRFRLMAAAVNWRADWMTRTINAIGSLRDLIEADETWQEINDLLAEEYGDDKDDA